jgi:diphosphomevalonate decarboxylase
MPTRSTSNRAISRASAPPNIALVKYWGKRDSDLNLPAVDSVSVCLDGPRTRVELTPSSALRVGWNGAWLPHNLLPPYRRLLEHLLGPPCAVEVQVTTAVPVAAGLAGSAAAMAALAMAANDLSRRRLDPDGLSAAARLGSGSAARSIPDGFAYWHRGVDPSGSDSFARSFAGPDHWPELRICALLLETGRKAVSSTEGMVRTAATSPLYDRWVSATNVAAPAVRDLIIARDFQGLAQVVLPHAMRMHATCLASSPPILYLSRRALELLSRLHGELPPESWFATFDAGTNPIFFTLEPHLRQLESALTRLAPGAPRLVSCVGSGARLESGPEES